MHNQQFTVQIFKDKETNLFVGFVAEVIGAHSQGETMEELISNLEEVTSLCLEEYSKDEILDMPDFIGVHKLSLVA